MYHSHGISYGKKAATNTESNTWRFWVTNSRKNNNKYVDVASVWTPFKYWINHCVYNIYISCFFDWMYGKRGEFLFLRIVKHFDIFVHFLVHYLLQWMRRFLHHVNIEKIIQQKYVWFFTLFYVFQTIFYNLLFATGCNYNVCAVYLSSFINLQHSAWRS